MAQVHSKSVSAFPLNGEWVRNSYASLWHLLSWSHLVACCLEMNAKVCDLGISPSHYVSYNPLKDRKPKTNTSILNFLIKIHIIHAKVLKDRILPQPAELLTLSCPHSLDRYHSPCLPNIRNRHWKHPRHSGEPDTFTICIYPRGHLCPF